MDLQQESLFCEIEKIIDSVIKLNITPQRPNTGPRPTRRKI